MIKVFGIGNTLLCDDAIGVRVLEKLLPAIQTLSPTIMGIIGETNSFFCLDFIEANDLIIIIDSTYLNVTPGTINYIPFSECDRFLAPSYSAHEVNLLKILRLEYPSINGYLIGIEISQIDFSTELSPLLEATLESICNEIFIFLKKAVKAHA